MQLYDTIIVLYILHKYLSQNWHQYVSEHGRRFNMLDKKDNMTKPNVNDSAYVFDAMWTAALALNRTETKLKQRNLSLKNFSYDDEHNISEMIYEEALQVEFFGLTVSLHKYVHTYIHAFLWMHFCAVCDV